MNKSPSISIVLPIKNEDKSIPDLWRLIKAQLDSLKEFYEVIFVDDNSDDSTRFLLEEYQNKYDQIMLIRLNKDSGQTEAMRRGFEASSGEIIISMDSDLQDNPIYIPHFIKKVSDGYDLVCGYRQKRKDAVFKRGISSIGNLLQSIIWRIGIHDISCTFRAYRKHCISCIDLSHKGYHRFIPYFIKRSGFKITEIPIVQGMRPHGKSHYNLFKSINTVVNFVRVTMSWKAKLVSYPRSSAG